ncbi:E3 ubiquitin-protein ligase TTC3 isoform X2 [Pseudophryne corroboree]|uniref:E3 ubiquitin-protein ligase TTC3 isoform X2 n=1 Tax=Pseudophryne corroboree TaxID=495146 RepID=UPI00308139DD
MNMMERTMTTEFSISTTRVIPVKCRWGHDTFTSAPVVDIVTKVDPVGFWLSLKSEEQRQNCNLLKTYMLWPVLMNNAGHVKKCEQPWSGQSSDMTIKELNFIELLEDLADLFQKVADQRRLIEGLLKIGHKMERPRHKVFPEAMNWVQSTRDQNVYKKLESQESLRNRSLQTFFTEYAFYLNRMGMDCKTLAEKVKIFECAMCEEMSGQSKLHGNYSFTNGKFCSAVEEYSHAIQYSPDNHFLFSNRALCFIRIGKYGKALSDGKKAVILKNSWPKGHYRFCEALFLLGETERAIASNEKAQELCQDCAEGIRDLIQQHTRFQQQIEEATEMKVKKQSKKKATSEKRLAAQAEPAVDNTESTLVSNAATEDVPEQETISGSGLENKECPGNVIGQQPKKGKLKGKESKKSRGSNATTDSKATEENVVRSAEGYAAMLEDVVKSLARDGYEALKDKRCHNAQAMFSQLLEILEHNELRSLHLTKIDYIVLMYGHANALLGTGQSEELTKAEGLFKEIVRHSVFSKVKFNCLAFYGLGNVYLRQNRFSDALNQYVKTKTMVKYNMVPGVLTWPTTSIVLEETRPEYFQVILDNCIEECKFPPKPNAVCRYENCLSLPKTQIYFSDPDFKGFIRMMCCRYCRVEFHICCWKRLKATKYSDKNDKDFLKYTCLTPDCTGFISHVVIYDSSAQVKCEFEDKTLKKKEPQKPTVKNRGASKKIKMKPENKAERKKKATEESAVELSYENKAKLHENIISEAAVTNGFHVTCDPLLLQVFKKQELIRSGCPMCFPAFWESVAAWRVINRQELDDLDRSAGSQPTFNKIKNLLNHLYTLNDSVKTRIVLYLLHLHKDYISIDLLDWVTLVDNKGLEAAQEFRELYEEGLRSIKFEDVGHLWNETYGKNVNYVMSDYTTNTLCDVLASMDVKVFRCFIWFLEENKQIGSVLGLQKKLYKYFQEMDVPRRQEPKQTLEHFSNISMNIKIKHKKKKRNQPKATYKLSGAVSTRSQEDDILTEENTLSLLDPYEPFLIPEYLRQDIDEFEVLYEPDVGRSGYEGQVDDTLEVVHSLEVIRFTLYEYFSQILEEYGPLKLDDELLIGQYKTFPEETHSMVEASGGLKNFLLNSSKFTMVDDLVVLSNFDFPYVVFGEPNKLNPAASEFKPLFMKPVHDDVDLYCEAYHLEHIYSSPTTAKPDRLSSVYSNLYSSNQSEFPHLCNDKSRHPLPFELSSNDSVDLGSDLADDTDEIHSLASNRSRSTSLDNDKVPLTSIPLFQEESCTEQLDQHDYIAPLKNEKSLKNIQTAIVSVQVDIEYSQHEVNTDPLQPFETQQGDILRMEKELVVLRDQLEEATEKYEQLQNRCQEEISGLQGKIKGTVDMNKLTKTELAWFLQEYENETKKWQQERKENQDKLKSLKNKIKTTTEANEKFSRNIEEKKKQYDKYIDDFQQIHLSKFELENAKVEKRIKKCEEERQEHKQRSIAAEVTVLENQKQCEMLKLRIKVSTAERSISVLKAITSSSKPVSAQTVQQIACLECHIVKLTKEMDTIKSQFDEKMNLVKSGLKLNSVAGARASRLASPPSALMLQIPPVTNPTPPANSSSQPFTCTPAPIKSPLKKAAAPKPAQPKEDKKPPAFPSSNSKLKNPAPAPTKAQAAAGQDRKGNVQPEARHQSPAKPTLFDKIIEELHNIFPHYKSAELASFIRDFRVRNNGTLSGFSHEEIISRVSEHILDYQAKVPSPVSPKSACTPWPGKPQPLPSPQPKQPWRVVTGGAKSKWQSANTSESYNDEPCIICHDELKQFPVHFLDCGHCFHKHCIKKWLNTQSTCPTCRDHALLPEDFPALSGRMRTV